MSKYEVKVGAQWGKSIPTLNEIFDKLSEKIDGVNANINSIRDDIMKKLEHAQKTADIAMNIATDAKRISEEYKTKYEKIEHYCDDLEVENDKLKGRMNHLDNYSRRDNLVIGGLKEGDTETPAKCEELIRNFFINKLKLEPDNVERICFVRCHRLGRTYGQQNNQATRRPRQIIIRFQNFSERQIVWAARRHLDDRSLSINENFCAETEFKRRKLYPIFRLAKSIDKYRNNVSLVEDTLYLNNRPYYVGTIGNLPNDLHPERLCEKVNEHCMVFGGLFSEFSKHSNWSPSRFTFKEKDFVCLEQGYMYNKAVINNDPTTARKICYTSDPREIKRLGSSVTVANRNTWNTVKSNLMLELVRAKYTQNEDLKKLLLETGNRKLGETGRDSFFSIGLPLTHPDVLNSAKWKSENQLGKALETVRHDFVGA